MAVGNTIGKLTAEPMLPKTTPAGSGNPPEKKSWWSKWGDAVHTGLDILGAVPVIGIVADGANAAIYAAEGDYVNAAISGASAAANLIPGGGAAMKAGKAAVAVGKQVTKTAAKEGAEALAKKAAKEAAEKAAKEAAEKAAKEGAEAAGKKTAKKAGSEAGGGAKGKGKKSKTCKIGGCTGKPVNPMLGIKFLVGPEDLDFDLPAPLRLPWQRSYFSDQPGNGWLGQGWSTPLSIRLVRRPDGLVLIDEQGREIWLPELDEGESELDRYEGIHLSRQANGRYRVSALDGGVHYDFAPLDLDGMDVQGERASYLPLVAMVDRNGNHLRVCYGGDGLPRQLIDAAGRNIRLRFAHLQTSAGNLPRLLGASLLHGNPLASGEWPDGQVEPLVHYDYDPQGDLVGVRRADGRLVRTYAYRNHILVEHAQPGGLQARYEYDRYDLHGKVIAHSTNTGQFWRFDYLADETQVVDNLDRRTRYCFNADHELIAFVDEAGGETRLERNAWGKVTAITDPLGNTSRFHYDAEGNRTAVIDPAGGRSEVQYHEQWLLPVAITDACGAITRYDYDAAGNLIRETDALGHVTRYNHDERGLVVRIIDAHGGRQKLEHDAYGQLLAHTDCLGHVTRYRWDDHGRQLAVEQADGSSTQFHYDRGGQLAQIVYPDGTSDSYVYDDLGRLTGHTSPQGGKTSWELAADGFPLVRINAAGQRIGYQYDGARRLVVLTNENGAYYRLAYDAKNSVIGEQGFDGRVTLYRYDAAGNLTERRELGTQAGPGVDLAADNAPELLRTSYLRDSAGRVVEKVTGRARDKRVLLSRYTYDAAGRLTSGVSEGGRVDVVYDELGRVVQETSLSSGRLQSVQHQYDGLNNRIRTVLPDGRSLDYRFYGPGYLHRIELQGDLLSEFERDIMQRETVRSQGVLRSYFDYDIMGRLVGQRARKDDAGAHDRIARRYVYDRGGNLQATSDLRFGQTTYRYDVLDRLVGANKERFAFDPAHNLVQAEGETARGNRVLCYEDKRFSYDTHGNLVEKRVGAHTLLRFAYDPEHRLESAEISRNGVVQKASYGYDAFGRRVWKRDSFGVTEFFWDGNSLLQEIRKSRRLSYVYDTDGFVPLAQLESGIPDDGGPAQSADVVRHFHTDQVGAPRELSEIDGRISWRANYRAWGNTLVVEYPEASPQDAGAEAAPVHQPFRFQGQYFDAETGLHYNRFRYYDPDIGRYVSQDPIRLAGGLNAYQYAPNPLLWIDVLGLAKRKRSLTGNDASGRPLTSPFYSTWVRTKIPCDLYDGTRSQHFRDANEQLHNMIKQNPELGTALGPKVVAHVKPGARGGFADTSPPGLTWHHNAQDPTFMELIPRSQHRAPGPVQDNLHPNQQGGFKKLKDC